MLTHAFVCACYDIIVYGLRHLQTSWTPQYKWSVHEIVKQIYETEQNIL